MTCYNSFKADEYAHQLGIEAEREMAVDRLAIEMFEDYLQDDMDLLGIAEDVHTYFSESVVDEYDIPRRLVKALHEKNEAELLRLAEMMADKTSEYVNDKLYEKALKVDDSE